MIVYVDSSNCIVIEEARLNADPVRITVTNTAWLIHELQAAHIEQQVRYDSHGPRPEAQLSFDQAELAGVDATLRTP